MEDPGREGRRREMEGMGQGLRAVMMGEKKGTKSDGTLNKKGEEQNQARRKEHTLRISSPIPVWTSHDPPHPRLFASSC